MSRAEMIIKDTHRGLLFVDGKLSKVLGAGRYRVRVHHWPAFMRIPVEELRLVDIRERDFTIKGQEILTADKVALRVSIIVRFRVHDPRAAVLEVEDYEDRIYSDVQLAARRSLASMQLETILTNRNQLSEDILAEVKDNAAGYGVTVLRADVKDLVFPGNLQQVMNRVLEAQRKSEADLVEARTRAEVQKIQQQTDADQRRLEAETEAEAKRRSGEAEAAAHRHKLAAEAAAIADQKATGELLAKHPELLKLRELETLKSLAANANARIYIGFDPAKNDG
ncbi:MAG: slipin family protein [Phycisphaerales bacterium]|nr:slipin family protein [Phycisphaerales bacterium]